MGCPGQLEHPEVLAVIKEALNLLNGLNVPSGILTLNLPSANMYIEQGTKFTAVGVDLILLTEAARTLREAF